MQDLVDYALEDICAAPESLTGRLDTHYLPAFRRKPKYPA
jgi:hypothetical protein